MKVYVIAGNKRQFDEWRSRQPRDEAEYVYISDYRQILGLHNVELRCVGEWWKRNEILDEAEARGLLVRR